MSTLFPVIPDIQDDPSTHATALRAMKDMLEQIAGQKNTSLLVHVRTYISAVDPVSLPELKGHADKQLRSGDQWIDLTHSNKLKFWDPKIKNWRSTT